MSRRVNTKWRPSLALILGATVAAMLALPAIGIISSRFVGREIGYLNAQFIFGSLIGIATMFLGWVLWRILYGPLRGLAAHADAIKRGEDGALEPLRHYGTQEMHALGQSMLEMGRVLKGREAVVRSYADHATHELKSPLTVVRGAAELLSEGGLSPEDQTRMISRIEKAASRMAILLDAQRDLARAQEPLGEGRRAALSYVVTGLRKEHPDLTIICDDTQAVLPLPAEQLEMILGHLFSNATAHGATKIMVSEQLNGFDVIDDGPGISAGNRGRVFDPFFTTRREAGGTGMGLAIVRRMLEVHGGEISLGESGSGALGGAHFQVRF